MQWDPESQVPKHKSTKAVVIAISPIIHLAMIHGFTKVMCTTTQVSKETPSYDRSWLFRSAQGVLKRKAEGVQQDWH